MTTNINILENRKNITSIFVFDLDGVIVDTLSSLYQVYLEFLRDFGIGGNTQEFDQLNGPSLPEIISFLNKKYHLPHGEEELLKKYDQKIKESYTHASLMDETEEILELLNRRGFPVALASSSKQRNVQFILNKFDLNKYFDFVVSGDEVTTAKPSPEIYHLVRDHFNDHDNNNHLSGDCKFYVIEDSLNGLKSAISAGMEVIHFNPSKRAVEVHPSYTISKMKEMENIILEVETNCRIEAFSKIIEVKVKELDLHLSPPQEELIDKIWTEEKEKNTQLFNGRIVSYLSHHFEGSVLVIESFLTEYKYFLAKLRNVSLNLNIAPLAVSGIIFDRDDNILVAQRKGVTEYNHNYEFLPSGGISISCIHDDAALFEKQLREEFVEETGMAEQVINRVQPFCFILDKNHQVYDICCKISLQTSLGNESSLRDNHCSKEYSSYKIVGADNLQSFVDTNIFVPTSIAISRILGKK